jgi:hypothetical protein
MQCKKIDCERRDERVVMINGSMEYPWPYDVALGSLGTWMHGLGVLIPGQRNQNNNKRWFPARRSIGGPFSQCEPGREPRQATRLHAHEVSPRSPCLLPGHHFALILSGTSRSHRPLSIKKAPITTRFTSKTFALFIRILTSHTTTPHNPNNPH